MGFFLPEPEVSHNCPSLKKCIIECGWPELHRLFWIKSCQSLVQQHYEHSGWVWAFLRSIFCFFFFFCVWQEGSFGFTVYVLVKSFWNIKWHTFFFLSQFWKELKVNVFPMLLSMGVGLPLVIPVIITRVYNKYLSNSPENRGMSSVPVSSDESGTKQPHQAIRCCS